MATAFDAASIKWPLSIEITKVAAVMSEDRKEWNQPVFISLSEVDYDDSEDGMDAGTVVLIVIGVLLGLAMVAALCYIFCWKEDSDRRTPRASIGSHYNREDEHEMEMAVQASHNAHLEEQQVQQAFSNSGKEPPGYTVPAPTPNVPAGTVEPPWQAVPEVDANSIPTGRTYYHNTATNEVAWDRPGVPVSPHVASTSPAALIPEYQRTQSQEDLAEAMLRSSQEPGHPIDRTQYPIGTVRTQSQEDLDMALALSTPAPGPGGMHRTQSQEDMEVAMALSQPPDFHETQQQPPAPSAPVVDHTKQA